ncbi:MAG: hypothetical protein Q4Q53_03425 [Methanocorpusculum sp.]|nr:hypothetical protein [Methanocorpusculum sp.]
MTSSEAAELLSSANVTLAEIRKAVHHLPKTDRLVLYDENHINHRSAVGKFFEALVYEILLSEAEPSDKIESIAAKLTDAEFIPYDKYSPDGLWYSRDGEIRFKRGKKVSSEVDLLLKTSDGTRIFGEVIVNPAGTKGFSTEVESKRNFLSELYGSDFEFLLVMPVSPKRDLKCLSEGDACAVILDGDKMYQNVLSSEVLKRNLSATVSSKRVDGRVW